MVCSSRTIFTTSLFRVSNLRLWYKSKPKIIRQPQNNPLRDSGSGFQDPGFRVPAAAVSASRRKASSLFWCSSRTLSTTSFVVQEGFGVQDVGVRVSSFGFRVSGFGFRVSGFGFRVSGLGFRVSGAWLQNLLVWGLGFMD